MNTGSISDGYHTFDELYDHRNLLFLALCDAEGGGWCSLKQSDGSQVEGWFIAGISLDSGSVTYHLPLRLWDLACSCCEMLPIAPEWDGHTSDDVLCRLSEHIERSSFQ